MRQEVFVRFSPDREFEFSVPADVAMASDEARRWLDDQFIGNDCQPLRATGKVLTADKVLVLAATVGPGRFADDAGFGRDFARATLAALGRPMVRIDVDASSITY